jgi:uncharacterized protein
VLRRQACRTSVEVAPVRLTFSGEPPAACATYPRQTTSRVTGVQGAGCTGAGGGWLRRASLLRPCVISRKRHALLLRARLESAGLGLAFAGTTPTRLIRYALSRGNCCAHSSLSMTSSWFSPKTEKRSSPIGGRGLFARAAISLGEIVAVKGGVIMDSVALAKIIDQVSPADIQIEEDLYIAPGCAEEVEANILCLNHSCQPNVGVRGQITFVAMREVPSNTELTIDYAMIDGDPKERMACRCAAPGCRKIITGDDWRRLDLRRKYAGYFSRYLAERIMGSRIGENDRLS